MGVNMTEPIPIFDFHSHTFLSDGVLSPVEMVRRAIVNGYRCLALTDHVGLGTIEGVVRALILECQLVEKHWDIVAIPGVEITHVPPKAIAEVAQFAKEMGAKLVVVHGETLAEPVEAGTNLEAIRCPQVDILAHPGLLTLEEASLASQNNVFLEITVRKEHCLTNGHVAKTARQAGAKLLVSSDAHEPKDLLTPTLAHAIALGAGLDEREAQECLQSNPDLLLKRIGISPPKR